MIYSIKICHNLAADTKLFEANSYPLENEFNNIHKKFFKTLICAKKSEEKVYRNLLMS